jgi:hypothetical protein
MAEDVRNSEKGVKLVIPSLKDLTHSQRRAIMSLPRYGSWTTERGKMSAAIDSLCLYHRDLAVSEWADWCPSGGRKMRTRLANAGSRFQRINLPALSEFQPRPQLTAWDATNG